MREISAKINFAKQDMNAKGIDACSEEERKMMWMHKTTIKIFIQMELEACRDECKLLLRCHHCIINICPEESCPPMPLSIPPDYAKNLMRRWETARKGILPPTLKMTLKRYYPLPVRQSPVPPHPEIPLCLSSLPCTESEPSGDDRTERDSLEAPADGSEEERSEIPLAGEPDDMTGTHRDGE